MSQHSGPKMGRSDSLISISMSDAAAEEVDFCSMYVDSDFILSSVSEPVTPEAYFSPAVLKFIRDAEVSLVNYEGMTDDAPRPNFKIGPFVDAHETCPSLLAEAGFTGVTLANNHVIDLGPDGVVQIMNRCQGAGLEALGAGRDMLDASSPNRLHIFEYPIVTHVMILNRLRRTYLIKLSFKQLHRYCTVDPSVMFSIGLVYIRSS